MTTQLGKNYTPKGLIARTTTQCIDPETGETGCWLYTGESHRITGSRISPLFPDLYPLFQWLDKNQWERTGTAYVKA